MTVARTIGPKVTQIVLYQDAVFGTIAAIITSVDKVSGNVGLTTFPPGQAPATQSLIRYDYTGAANGTWRYHETDVI